MTELVAILTDTGRALMAAANNGATLRLMTFGVEGADYTPTPDQTALVNEVHSGSVNNVYQKPDDATVLVIEVVLGVDLGPFTMRAVGLYAESGALVAVVQTPETEIMPASQGFAVDTTLEIFLLNAGSASVELTIDPSLTLATTTYVDAAIARVDVPEVEAGGEDRAGVLQLATQEETQEGTNTARAIHPAGAAATYMPLAGGSFTGAVDVNSDPVITQTALDTALNAVKGVPIGAILPSSSGVPLEGTLPLEGGLLLRADYPELWAWVLEQDVINDRTLVTDTLWNNDSWGSYSTGDGSTTFRVPDFRGEGVRGFDNGRGVDPGRLWGKAQGMQVQDLFAEIVAAGNYLYNSRQLGTPSWQSNYRRGGGWSNTTHTETRGVPVAAMNNGTETRMRNLPVLFCVKY